MACTISSPVAPNAASAGARARTDESASPVEQACLILVDPLSRFHALLSFRLLQASADFLQLGGCEAPRLRRYLIHLAFTAG
ncbi:MAG: hypothetical protein QHJ34_11570 [bacterium]|nr:hypothetical protein [candidate division KSB1 bacterium]MDH7560852.1 hypothetical protein [bacterium]